VINRANRTLIQAARFLIGDRPTANDMASSVPETLTKMKRQHTYRREKDRIGAQGCIYCNGPAPLTLEHIIPENIGGMLTIERASCAFCADETGCVRRARLSRNVADAETNEISAKYAYSLHRSRSEDTAILSLTALPIDGWTRLRAE
jgi:hypothetical protein